MTDNAQELNVQIGEACEIDPAAGPIESRQADPNAERDVLVYLTVWCGDCRRAVRFLDEFDIPYRTIDIEQDAEAARAVEAHNGGSRSVPTILIDGKHVATEPSRSELASIFGVGESEATGAGKSPLNLLRRRR